MTKTTCGYRGCNHPTRGHERFDRVTGERVHLCPVHEWVWDHCERARRQYGFHKAPIREMMAFWIKETSRLPDRSVAE